MTTRIRIRSAQPKDRDALVEMVERLGGTDAFDYEPGWIGSADGLAYVSYHIEKGWVAVADLDGDLVGHCSWSIKKGRPHQAFVRFAELETLFVSPVVRNKGIADALVDVFGQFCRRQALSVQLVHVLPEPRSIALFERLGYVEKRRLLARTTAEL